MKLQGGFGGATWTGSLLGSLLALGCAEPSKSSLEQRAAAIEQPPPSPPPPLEQPPPFTVLPPSRLTPPGVAPERWALIHWLPPTAFDIGGFTGQQAPIVEWFRRAQLEFASDPACTRSFDGIEHVITLKEGTFDPTQQSTNVLIGRLELGDVMACTRRVVAELGGTIERDGPITIATFGDTSLYMAWATLDTSTVVVWKVGDRVALERMLTAAPDRLAESTELVSLLAALRKGPHQAWSVNLANVGGALLGVPTVGMGLTLEKLVPSPDGVLRADLHLAFASVDEAKTAREPLADLFEEIQQVSGVTIGLDCDELERDPIMHCALGFTVTPGSGGGVEQIGRIVTLLQDRVARNLSSGSAPGEPSRR